MMLWAHVSPQPKRHLDWFSCVCTDDRSVPILYNGLPVPPPKNKLPLPMLASGWHDRDVMNLSMCRCQQTSLSGSLDSPKSATQMATWSFQPFCSERIHRDTDPCVVCKFREIWPTGNQNKILPHSRFCADHAQNLPGPAADNVFRISPNFIQISSLLAEPNAWTLSKRAIKWIQYLAEATGSRRVMKKVSMNTTTHY